MMILFTSLYVLNIVILMALAGQLIGTVCDMKYGVYWSVVRSVRYKDYRGINWIYKNPVYILDIFFIIILFFLIMTLAGQLIHNDILNRPIFILVLSPLAWFCVYLYIKTTNKRIKVAEQNK